MVIVSGFLGQNLHIDHHPLLISILGWPLRLSIPQTMSVLRKLAPLVSRVTRGSKQLRQSRGFAAGGSRRLSHRLQCAPAGSQPAKPLTAAQSGGDTKETLKNPTGSAQPAAEPCSRQVQQRRRQSAGVALAESAAADFAASSRAAVAACLPQTHMER